MTKKSTQLNVDVILLEHKDPNYLVLRPTWRGVCCSQMFCFLRANVMQACSLVTVQMLYGCVQSHARSGLKMFFIGGVYFKLLAVNYLIQQTFEAYLNAAVIHCPCYGRGWLIV